MSPKHLVKLVVIALASLLSPLCSGDATPNVEVEPYRTLVNDTIRVPAGQSVRYELSLNRGAKLVAQFHVSGGLNRKIRVLLLDMDNYQSYVSGHQYRYYHGTTGVVRETGNYTFDIPQTNVYVLVIDNGGALMLSRTVGLYVYEAYPMATPESERGSASLQKVYDGLRQLLVFDEFKILVRHCGVENAFSDPNITLCAELDDSLSKNGMEMAMPFVFFHEVGHSMLRLWGYPLSDNEDVADEFSTVMWLMFKKNEPPLTAARWFSSQTSQTEAMSKIWVDDRHTISPQRARNIVHWLNQPNELLKRWQKILIPNMQTAALQALQGSHEPWVDHKLIESQLALRQ